MFRKRHSKKIDPAIQLQARYELNEWYRKPLGQALLEYERKELDDILSNLFGYHLLQVGILGHCHVLGQSRIHHCSLMDGDYYGVLCAEPESWPIAGDSVDVVLLPHVLEFSPDPHQVLRELDRSLIPEGHLVLLGFNPFSLWYLWSLILAPWKKAPWNGNFYSMRRLKDWLSLLGFDMVYSRSYFFRPPITHPGILHKIRFLERLGQRSWPFFGGGYIMVAKKRVTALTPIRPRWRARRKFNPADAISTNMRDVEHD